MLTVHYSYFVTWNVLNILQLLQQCNHDYISFRCDYVNASMSAYSLYAGFQNFWARPQENPQVSTEYYFSWEMLMKCRLKVWRPVWPTFWKFLLDKPKTTNFEDCIIQYRNSLPIFKHSMIHSSRTPTC